MEYIASAADSDTDPSCMRLLPGVAKSLARSVGPPKAARTLSAAAASEMWKSIPMGAPDPILGLVEAFKKDDNPKKVSLSAGTYRTDEGSHLVLPSIKTAEDRVVAANYDKEYLPITGLQARAPPPSPLWCPAPPTDAAAGGATQAFNERSRVFALGPDSPSIKEGRIASVQTLSGTGACRVIGEFFCKFLGPNTPFYLSNPSWGNHAKIFAAAGLDVRSYRYWNPKTLGLDLDGMLADLKDAPDGSAVLLHA